MIMPKEHLASLINSQNAWEFLVASTTRLPFLRLNLLTTHNIAIMAIFKGTREVHDTWPILLDSLPQCPCGNPCPITLSHCPTILVFFFIKYKVLNIYSQNIHMFICLAKVGSNYNLSIHIMPK